MCSGAHVARCLPRTRRSPRARHRRRRWERCLRGVELSMSAPCPTFGFLVVMELGSSIDASANRELRDSWIGFLETRGLSGTDGGTVDETRATLRFVVTSEASQATETDREAAE